MNTTNLLLKLTAVWTTSLLTFAAPSFGQGFSVTNVSVPNAAAVSVSALNAGGQLAGYYETPSSTQRAFRWENGASVDLGTLGGSLSFANAMNRFGQVTGSSTSIGETAEHAFLGIDQTLFDLGTLGGSFSAGISISDAGHVAGNSSLLADSVDNHAFLQSSGNAMVDLGTLGGASSLAKAVNNAGQVVGESTTAGDAETHAFRYSGAMVDLGTLGGGLSTALSLNDSGSVAGYSSLASGDFHAFVSDGTTLTDLNTLGGASSFAYVINNAGHVIGDSDTADVANHAFLYDGASMRDLGTLGGTFSTPWSINSADQIVGNSVNALGEQRAFLWQEGVMRDLNTSLPTNSGWELTSAYFINDNGQIAGVGTYQGLSTWYLLTPRAHENQSPVANAGPDQTVEATGTSASVTLNGSASSDPDGDTLTFQWLEGSVSLGATPSVAPSLALGTHTITLRVADPDGASADDTVVIVVTDTAPPVFQCPANLSAAIGENCQAAVPDLLANLVATDNGTAPSALSKTQNPAAGTLVGPGTHAVLITVTDAAGNAAACSVTLTVADTTPPHLTSPEPVSVTLGDECQAGIPDLAPFVLASDNCTPSGQLVFTQNPAAGTPVGAGESTVLVKATDQAGNAATCAVLLRVKDLTAPVIQSLTADHDVLRPPNHQMVPVALSVVAADNCDSSPSSHIVSVSSSEGGDNNPPDWNITGPLTVQLRAEVFSKEIPRSYSITVVCTDAAGNATQGTVVVQVTKSKN